MTAEAQNTVKLSELFNKALRENKTDKQKHPAPNHKNYPLTGIHYVSISRCDGCKQGFIWRYQTTLEDGTSFIKSSVDLLKLKQSVQDAGMSWSIYNIHCLRDTAKMAECTIEDLL